MPVAPSPIRSARFGVFEVDFAAGEVRKSGIKIKLHDQPIQILALLISRPGELVTREDIRKILWPGDTFVDFDHGLNNAVNRLRDALGDSADSPRWIETLPRRGYRFIGNVTLADSAGSAADSLRPSTPVAVNLVDQPPTLARYRGVLSAAAVVIAVAALLLTIGLKKLPSVPSSRSFVLPPDGATFDLVGDDGGSVGLSSDGTKLAFIATDSKASATIWTRPLGNLAAEPLAGTEGASFPFWSPDGHALGFFANGKLKKAYLADGSITTLADAPSGRGGSWNRDGVIIFAPDSHSGIHKIAASGGMPIAITKVDSSIHTTHRWPKFLPDGRHFIYLAANHFPDASNNGVYRGSLNADENMLLIHSDADATYASGYFFFLRDKTLMAQRFDPERGKLLGEPRPTVERVLYDRSIWKAVFDVSQNGVMAYELGSVVRGTQLSWFNRSGQKIGEVGEPQYHFDPRLSPDGRRLSVGIQDGGYSHVRIYDLLRGPPRQITFGRYDNESAVWFPDGKRLLIAAKRKHYSIYSVDSDGTTQEQLLLDTGTDTWPIDLSPNGRFLLYGQGVNIGRTKSQTWVLPMTGKSSPYRLLDSLAVESDARFSPDGRWVSYASNQSGQEEVYVVPFRARSARSGDNAPSEPAIQISHSGGRRPRWQRDGRELFYLASDNSMMAVQVETGGQDFKTGEPHSLFWLAPTFAIYAWDVSSDGSKFIIETAPRETSAPITLVQNWLSDFR